MKRLTIHCVLAAMLGFITLNGQAIASETHEAELLEGSQETPAVITGAAGRFTLNIADGNASFDFELTYAGIEGGAVTQAHIHVGQPNVPGGIVIFLCTNLAPPAGVPVPPPCPQPRGTVTGTRTAADVLAQTTQGVSTGELSAVLAAIRLGLSYANVHSTASPAGEIRGQIK
jgi:hypothetical protein